MLKLMNRNDMEGQVNHRSQCDGYIYTHTKGICGPIVQVQAGSHGDNTRGSRDDLFVATPPLEAWKILLSLAMAEGYGCDMGKAEHGLHI